MPHCLLGAKLKQFLMTSDAIMLMQRDVAQVVLRDMADAFTSCSEPYLADDYCEKWEFRYLQERRGLVSIQADKTLPFLPLRSAVPSTRQAAEQQLINDG